MRVVSLVCLFATACGGDDGGPGPFVGQGGTIEIADCAYSVTTKIGADAPALGDEFVGAAPTPRLIHLGIIGDAKTSMVVQWRTMDETTTATEIHYAEGANLAAGELTKHVTGIEFAYETTGTQNFRMHQAHLCGLKPATSYSYQVGDEHHLSPVYTFHTAPDIATTPDAEVVLGFVGDSRSGEDVWAQLVPQIQQRSPDLMLFSGDAVLVGLTQDEWEVWLAASEAMFATVPVVLTNGNHENNAVTFYSQFAMPGDQENFGFDYGHAHVTVANDTPEDGAGSLTTTTHDAIAAELTASDSARWKLFMSHQPMWSSGTTHGSNLTLRASWQPLIDQHHVDLVLNGHEHQYEVTKPLIGDVVQQTGGTVYVVAGGAGADLYGFGAVMPWSAYTEMTHSAAVIHIRRDVLELDSFHPDGTPIQTGVMLAK